jgi:uncharacterized OsmC-like protein
MGGKDSAPQPVELLLASFIGCTQATALFVGRNMKPRILIDKIEFDLNAKRDDRGVMEQLPISERSKLPTVPARLTEINGSITVFAKDRTGETVKIDDEQIKILEMHTEHRCPVANMIVSSGCTINVIWKDGVQNM